jgi:hypothetical protein
MKGGEFKANNQFPLNNRPFNRIVNESHKRKVKEIELLPQKVKINAE